METLYWVVSAVLRIGWHRQVMVWVEWDSILCLQRGELLPGLLLGCVCIKVALHLAIHHLFTDIAPTPLVGLSGAHF